MDEKSRLTLRILILGLMLLPTCRSASDAPAIVNLRILETTDMHCALMDFDYAKDRADPSIGLVRAATLIRRARQAAANTILVDNGDLIQGTVLGDYVARNRALESHGIHPMIEAMNALNYDAANVGNHDLNYGLDFLHACVAGAEFPFVCANLCRAGLDQETPIFDPYVVLTRDVVDERGKTHELRVGLIGLLPPQVMQWDRNHLEGRAMAGDMVETTKALVPVIRPKVDVLVVLAHSGLSLEAPRKMDENAVYALSQIDGIDAIAFGHTHDFFPGPSFDGCQDRGIDNQAGTINEVPAVMAGMYANRLGIIDLRLKLENGSWFVADGRAQLMEIAERTDQGWRALVPADETIVALAKAHHREAQDWVRKPLGETRAPLSSYFALVTDCAVIQLIADAQMWYGRQMIRDTAYADLPVLAAAAPFKAGHRRHDQFTHIPAGPVSFRHVADMYPYPNTISIVAINGAELRDWLDMSAGVFNSIDLANVESQFLINRRFPTFNFDVIKGVVYDINVTRKPKYDENGAPKHPDSSRIDRLMFAGKPVTDEQKFLVVTNSYRASGGGSFPHVTGDRVVLEAPVENRSIIADYISHRGVIQGTWSNNWRVTTGSRAARLRFRSSSSGQAATLVRRLSSIHFTGQVDADGFGIYVLETERGE